MTSSSSDHSEGPLAAEEEGPPTPTDSETARAKRDEVPTRPPPPVRRQTMEVQMAWLDLRPDEPRIEQIVATEATPKTRSVSPISDALQSDTGDIADAFPENEAATVPRQWPPRLPGAVRSVPPMPLVPSKPPPPPRRITTQVKMEWVELVEDDLIEEPPSVPTLPKLHDDERWSKEVTRREETEVFSERIENEKAAALADSRMEEELEGPSIPDAVREARLAEETAKKERLSEFLQATSGSIPPGALTVSEIPPASTDADHDRMREDALAARKREQDERDRKILARRRAARERERLEEEARRALREHSRREEEERLEAIRHGTPDGQLLDLSGSGVDKEIDHAIDKVLGKHLSYPPPPPSDEEK